MYMQKSNGVIRGMWRVYGGEYGGDGRVACGVDVEYSQVAGAETDVLSTLLLDRAHKPDTITNLF